MQTNGARKKPGQFFTGIGNDLGVFFKQTIPGAIKQVYSDTIGLANKALDIPKDLSENTLNTLNHLGDNVEGFGSSLAMPLVIGGIGILALLMMNKR